MPRIQTPLRLTPEEKEIFTQAATDARLSLNEWVLQACHAYLDPDTSPDTSPDTNLDIITRLETIEARLEALELQGTILAPLLDPDTSPDIAPDIAPDTSPDTSPDIAPDPPQCPKCGSDDTRWKSWPQRKLQCKGCGKFTTIK